jgi:glycerophosphoryl diester phosphodiesterase
MYRGLLVLFPLILAPTAQAAVPAVHAHRGGPVVAGVETFGEETLPAFQHTAQELHVVLELDAKLTADGVPVVIHDDTLERTTNCEGLVADKTLAELAPCLVDALGVPVSDEDPERVPAPDPQPIPTLAEVLAFAKTEGIGINLEIKNVVTDDDYDPTSAYANRVMDVVLESGIPASQVIIQSFMPDNLTVAEDRMPDAQFSFLSLAQTNDPAIDFASARGWDWISPQWPIDAAYVERAHASNLKVVPYTLNLPEDVATASEVGVDAVITDDPLMALQTLDTEPAVVGLEPLSKKLERVRRKRKLRVGVSSVEPATVDLIARFKRKVIGRTTVTFEEAGNQRVAIPLNRRGRRALADREAAKVKLVAKTTDVALNRGTVRTRMPLG